MDNIYLASLSWAYWLTHQHSFLTGWKYLGCVPNHIPFPFFSFSIHCSCSFAHCCMEYVQNWDILLPHKAVPWTLALLLIYPAHICIYSVYINVMIIHIKKVILIERYLDLLLRFLSMRYHLSVLSQQLRQCDGIFPALRIVGHNNEKSMLASILQNETKWCFCLTIFDILCIGT